jgi:hypothetical protein
MPYAKILSIHCHKTYNANGKDSITIKLDDERGTYTFDADDIEANTIREVNDGLNYFGQTVHLILSLNNPNIDLGDKYLNRIHLNQGVKRVTFRNLNADYEIFWELSGH